MLRAKHSAESLRGQQVAFSGRLASMTQAEAVELVRESGGTYVDFPSRQTDFLVVGREGWPLRQDGHVSRRLARAQALQEQGHGVEILSEEDFLSLLGLDERQKQIHDLYTIAQLTRMLGIPRDRLRRWVREGLVSATKTVHRLPYFDFHQVAGARALWELTRAGVPIDRIRQSLGRIQAWMPSGSQPLTQLTLLERSRHLFVRLESGAVADPSGQLYFPFPELVGHSSEPQTKPLRPSSPQTVDEWFDRSLRYEEEGNLGEAAQCYREALLLAGPEPDICFNLGNVLYSMGRKEPAAERFRQAVELDAEFIEAWNNLGNALGDLGEWDDAVAAYQTALSLDPTYSDAHFNLAETLHRRGDRDGAHKHWRTFLKQDPRSPLAKEVRQRLENNE